MEDCGKCQKEHEYRLEKIEERLEKIEECQTDMKIQAKEFEQSSKSAHKRLDSIEEQTKAIYKLSTAVEQMTEQVKENIVMNKEHSSRLDSLEKAPGELLKKYAKVFIGSLVTGAAGAILTSVILKN